MTGNHGFRRSIIFALFFLFIGSTGVSNYIKSCLTTENVFWSDFLVRKVATSTEKPGFAIWFRPTSRYGFFTAHRTNNRADSSPCKLFSSWQLRHIATIFSSAKVGILTRERKLKRCKHPCLYYSNSSATFHCVLEGDLVFKLNPGPYNGGQSTIQPRCSRRCQAPLSAHLPKTTKENNYYSSIPVRITTRLSRLVSNFSTRNVENLVSISPVCVPHG